MDKELLTEQLAEAERHVQAGEGLVARQRVIVARMAASRADAKSAREILTEFERAQRLSIEDRDRLRKLLAGLCVPGPLIP